MTIEFASVAPRAGRSSSPRGGASRIRVSLVCTECESRNYSTTRKPERSGQLSFKKFCPTCNKHAIHKETK
jgi:large subunit ribosomal protein L33